jgi:hypothetical protein
MQMAGKRLFISGLIVMSLFALGHFGGFLQAAYKARHDPGMADLTRAMRDHKANLFGFQPSILDFREYFSLNFSILLLLAAALGVTALTLNQTQPEIIRTLSLIYLIAFSMLSITSMVFSVFQGIVTCLIITVLFGLSWWTAR